VLAELERANIAWAQAGIEVVMIGAPIIEEAPVGSDGFNILSDGWFDFNASVVAVDELAVIESIGAGAAIDVVEVVFTGPLTTDGAVVAAFGVASMPAVHASLAVDLQNNTYLLIGPNVDVRHKVLAHEVGHALTSQFDSSFTPYIYFPADATPTDDMPDSRRMLRHDTETTVRIRRDTGCLACPGNVLLIP